jgi:hypothetical protein
MDATPTLTAGTMTACPAPLSKRTGHSAWTQNIRSGGAMTIRPTRQHPCHIRRISRGSRSQ